MKCKACAGDGELPLFSNDGEQVGFSPCPKCQGLGKLEAYFGSNKEIEDYRERKRIPRATRAYLEPDW